MIPLLQHVITYFPDRNATTEPEYYMLQWALYRIRDGASKALVEQIRAESDKGKRNQLKGKLPCVLFSGQFMKRANDGIQKHSGLIVLDFDDCDNSTALFDTLTGLEYIVAVWHSPSGTGIKAIARVPRNESGHRGYFEALQRQLPAMDKSGKDVARICYESYDPAIYINPDAVEYNGYVAPVETTRPAAPVATDFGKLNVCVNMIRRAIDGEKHQMLVKAATLAGGFIAAGHVNEADAVRLLEAEVQANMGPGGAQGLPGAFKTIADQIAYGKTRPIYEQTAEEHPAEKTESTHSIIYLSAVWELMQHEFVHGKARGETTHLPPLEGKFSWKAGDLTLISGRPNAGKSEFIAHLMLLKSVMVGWKWAVFCPENYPPSEFYDSLIHGLVGKSVDPVYANQMTKNQYAEAASFIHDHFFFIYPGTRHTIEEFEKNVEYCIKHHGVKGCLIDPFNQLSREFKERDDQYLEEFLTSRKRFALENKLNYVITLHPTKPTKTNADGEYLPADYGDLAGGAMWGNKADNFLVVYRPYQSGSPENTTVEIIVRKIKKQRLVGIPGTATLGFDRAKNRYTYLDITDNVRTALDHINSNAEGKKGKLAFTG